MEDERYHYQRHNDGTDDDWLTKTNYPLREWEWFDGLEPTC